MKVYDIEQALTRDPRINLVFIGAMIQSVESNNYYRLNHPIMFTHDDEGSPKDMVELFGLHPLTLAQVAQFGNVPYYLSGVMGAECELEINGQNIIVHHTGKPESLPDGYYFVNWGNVSTINLN